MNGKKQAGTSLVEECVKDMAECERVLFTPNEASLWLEKYRFDKQRPLDRAWVEDLKRHLATGEFKSGGIEVCVLAENRYLTDGQHRLTAISESDSAVYMTVTYYDCETMDQVRAIYWRTDGGKGRGATTAIDVAGLSEKYEMPNSRLSSVRTSANFVHAGFRNPGGRQSWSRDRDCSLRIIEDWIEYAKWYYSIIDEHEDELSRAFKARGVQSVFLCLLRYQKEEAESFLRAVANHDRLERDSPEMYLYQQLLKVQAAHRHGSVSQELLARIVAGCWNARAKGGRVPKWDKLKKTEPVLLHGTPFDKSDMMPIPPPILQPEDKN